MFSYFLITIVAFLHNGEYTFTIDSLYFSVDKDNNVVKRLIREGRHGWKLPSTAHSFTTFEL